jgi:hypothetical protein
MMLHSMTMDEMRFDNEREMNVRQWSAWVDGGCKLVGPFDDMVKV